MRLPRTSLHRCREGSELARIADVGRAELLAVEPLVEADEWYGELEWRPQAGTRSGTAMKRSSRSSGSATPRSKCEPSSKNLSAAPIDWEVHCD